jgi:hypothetical protein
MTPVSCTPGAIAAIVLALGCAGSPPPGRQEARPPMIRVGPNIRVSESHSRDTHYEVVIAAHPRDPSRLIAASIIYPEGVSAYGTIVYQSSDGGVAWSPARGLSGLGHTGDPALAYGPEGLGYYVASSLPEVGERRLLLFRSPDGGANWDGPFPLTYMDREYVTVDATTRPSRGRVYVNGNNRVPRTVSDFVVFQSSDSGRTFRGPGTRSALGSVQATVVGNAVVASDAALIGVYVEARASERSGATRASIQSIWSVDGGATLAGSAMISDYVAGGERKGALLGNANAEPALAIDATSGRFKDRLYVVWPDRRSGHSEILFSSSVDKGRTWSPSRRINDNAPDDTTDQFMPEIAVNRDGVVGVLWYDRREHPDNLGWDARFAASFDGGASFTPSVRVSHGGASFPPGTSREKRTSASSPPRDDQERLKAQIDAGRDSFMFMGGDTAGLVADASGIFHAAWVDNRTGVPQLWTAAVSVPRCALEELHC